MWGFNNFHVRLMINVPNLWHQRQVRLNNSTDILFETTYDHSVGHDERERMVKLHFLVNGSEVLIFEKDTSSGVMTLKASDIEDIVI